MDNGISNITDDDHRFMAAAIRYGVRHEGLTGTNPSVACLLVKKIGKNNLIIGRGITAIGGRPHAEAVAIAQAGDLTRGATAYVTLEPCAHHGKTPPCAEALVAAGIERVVIATLDPDKRVCGKGIKILERVGLEVVTPVMGKAARFGLAGYLTRKNTAKPFVTLKLAVSKDGFLGSKDEGKVALTGSVANAQSHMLRAINDAILIGSGTANADDPDLTCRLPGLEARYPIRIILSKSLEIPFAGKLAMSAKVSPVIVVGDRAQANNNLGFLQALGMEFLPGEVEDGEIALPELLDDLAARGIASLMVEGGAQIAKSFLNEGLVDRIHLYTCEKELGEGIASPLTQENIPHGFEEIRSDYYPNGEGRDSLTIYQRTEEANQEEDNQLEPAQEGEM